MKIITVIGARPQFIKAAAVSRAIKAYNDTLATDSSSADSRQRITEVIVHTGQHFDRNMSEVFFEEMDIPRPDYNLDINSMSHGAMTGRMLEKIEEILLQEKPDFVMVYGDTNSTLAGALAAKKLHIKVAHVEAGLRSFNMRMPEEINRILTDRISDILCCPSNTAVKNLQNEGFVVTNSQEPAAIHQPLVENTGDVMLDAALYYSTVSAEKSTIIKDLYLDGKDFALCTIHRAENTNDPDRLSSIFAALYEISKEMKVVLPLHPRTRKVLETNQSPSIEHRSLFADFLIMVDPVGYFDMLELLKQTRIVLTDSGGLQKEAYFFRKPCVTLRDETEWVELVDGGFNMLGGVSFTNILWAFREMRSGLFHADADIYGNGNAAKKIVAAFQNESTLNVI